MEPTVLFVCVHNAGRRHHQGDVAPAGTGCGRWRLGGGIGYAANAIAGGIGVHAGHQAIPGTGTHDAEQQVLGQPMGNPNQL